MRFLIWYCMLTTMPQLHAASEYTQMHFIYSKCGANPSRAEELYQERFHNARHPDYRVFIPRTGICGTSPRWSLEHNEQI